MLSSGSYCLDYDTTGHFPSALFQGVLVEYQTLGPQQRQTGACCLRGPAGRVGTCWVLLSASQLCVSGEEKLVYPAKEVDGTSLFILKMRDFRKLKTCNSTYLSKFTKFIVKNGITLYYQSVNTSNYSTYLKF